MRRTLIRFAYEKLKMFESIPGKMDAGKHQIKRIITRKEIKDRMMRLAKEEENMKYLRTPYLTVAEESAYIMAFGKDPYLEKWVEPMKETKIEHRRAEEIIVGVRQSNEWE